MSIEEDIRTALLAMSAVADFNGSGSADEMVIRYGHQEVDDDITDPHIIIDIDSDAPETDLSGSGGLNYAELTITCRALTMALSKSLATAVKLNGTSPGTGLMGFGDNTTAFNAIQLNHEVRSQEGFGDNSERFWDVTIQDWTVGYNEDV